MLVGCYSTPQVMYIVPALNFSVVDYVYLHASSRSFHKCSIADKSGDRTGLGRMFCCWSKLTQTRAIRHIALHCWNMLRFPCLAMKGCRMSLSISSRNRSPVRWPSTISSSVRSQCGSPHHCPPRTNCLDRLWDINVLATNIHPLSVYSA